MKKISSILLALAAAHAHAQVGIGTTTPLARLHVVDSSVLFSANGDIPAVPAAPPVSGDGRRMMWYADKAAFRTGYVGTFGANYWDMSQIGNYSFAAGYNPRAAGDYSLAVGLATTATGEASVALGNNGTATAERSMTFNGTASAVGAIALGSGAQATNDEALALGLSSIANGLGSVTIGPSITLGSFAVAIGLQNRASGNFSTAIGKNARVNHQGSCVIGDGSAQFSSDSVYSSTMNELTMRFAGGVRMFTTMNLSSGVVMAAGGSSWAAVSDRRKKEHFHAVNTEEVLQKVAAMPVTEWNYKTQPESQRHMGPMAQDFYRAFRLDGIGNDTTINSIDIDGVNMAAIQALEKRTATLQQENDELKATVEAMKLRMAAMERMVMDQPRHRRARNLTAAR